MVNLKKKNYFDCITGESVSGKSYGTDAVTFKKVDNIDMVYDSRGLYLGMVTCRGSIKNGKFTGKKGPRDFKSFIDLKIWAGKRCSRMDFIETKYGINMQIDPTI